ncbi:hypothetical protein V8C86DRAFT_269970 [Haematococcus lacustris]
MAKTDDNVKEFLEKCVKRHKPASTSEPSCSQPAASAEQGGKEADIESLLGKWMYATGSSFRSVEVPEFKDLIHALRPDFIIPTRKKMGGELLLNDWLLVSLELGRGSWLLASLELGRGSWLLVNVDGQDVDELLHLLQPQGAQGHQGTDKVE